TFFCTLGLTGFLLARRWPAQSRKAIASSLLAWTAFALAILTKGPLLPAFVLIGLLVAKLVVGPRGAWLASFRPLLGLAICALVVGPWIASVLAREPHALEYWRAQMFERTGGVGAAWWRPLEMFYVIHAAVLVLPWALLLLPAMV